MPSRITAERLRLLFDYDPETGVFRWAMPHGPGWNIPPGGTVGSFFKPANDHRSGYLAISISGRTYNAHRLAWLYMTGKWPGRVDHIDMDGTNNRWSNLREATHSQNMHNRRPKGRSGIKGVDWMEAKKKWRAQIRINGKGRHLGVFNTAEEAKEAYRQAAVRLYGDFARP